MDKFQQTGHLIDIAGELILRGEQGDYKFLAGNKHWDLLGKKISAFVYEPKTYKPWNARGWICPESIQLVSS